MDSLYYSIASTFDLWLLIHVFIGIGLLLLMILRLKLPAFISLLICSIVVALLSGIPAGETMNLIKTGMGNTLGFVAVVIGLGAMFGAILEQSGGATTLANFLLARFKESRSDFAMVVAGFFIAIPVFFDVAFIILAPVIYALQRKTKKSLLFYAIPLLAGLAVTHAFIPPTPGPIAVADILNADLGLVIFFGFIIGLPTAIVAGPIFGRFISKRIHIDAPPIDIIDSEKETIELPPSGLILSLIAVPILLIVANTLLHSPFFIDRISPSVLALISVLGHPFSALIVANLLVWYLLGLRRGTSSKELLKITTASLGPAGIIILLTGAGGVFKEVLITTGIGEQLATYFAEQNIGLLFFAFIAAVLVRVLQGSSTVAMITAAGLTAPLITEGYSDYKLALLVIAIASGASIFSHVNDSGFWLVNKYLGLSEQQTFRSWSIMTLILSLVSMTLLILLSQFV